MRYTIFNIILISTLFTLLASAQNDKDVVEVQQILMRQAADWNKGDIEAFMVGYWNSPDLQFIGSRGVTKSYENTLRNYLKSYPDRKTMGQLSFDVISIDKLSRKSIMLTGQYTLARKKMEDASGYFLLVWKKIKKKWVIVADHSN